MIDYIINPVLMGGLVKECIGDNVKVHLHGRLGVLTVPRGLIDGDTALEPGHELRFWFSYLQVVSASCDYDAAAMQPGNSMTPTLLGGTLVEVNDTAVKAETQDGLGFVAVPRRWVFTDVPLAEGQTVEFYLSRMTVVGKRDIPAASI